MAETKKITSLYVVTDSETSYDKIGDIDGGLFPDGFLEDHIKRHGANGLLEKLACMTSSVIIVKNNVERKNENSNTEKPSIQNDENELVQGSDLPIGKLYYLDYKSTNKRM